MAKSKLGDATFPAPNLSIHFKETLHGKNHFTENCLTEILLDSAEKMLRELRQTSHKLLLGKVSHYLVGTWLVFPKLLE